jgi:hypothetical protein
MDRRTISQDHLEWLGLIVRDGPFVSPSVLLKTFPQGLGSVPTETVQTFRQGFEEWNDGQSDPRKHIAWIELVLSSVLEHDENYLKCFDGSNPVPEELQYKKVEYGETIAPRFFVCNRDDGPDAEKPRMPVFVHDRAQDLNSFVRLSSGWNATPRDRASEYCRAVNVPIALVTNGHQWMLVHAPEKEMTGSGMWTSEFLLDERVTFRAFCALLNMERFFAEGDEETTEKLLERSRQDEHEVTDQLGYQVRTAVELFVNCLERADRGSNERLLLEIDPSLIYESVLTVMMRLIVLLSAEEKDLLPMDDLVYTDHYAVTTLRDQLQEHEEGILEARYDAWPRLLSLFRMVHSGVNYDSLSFPGYGGNLFDPDRFAFLEGRKPDTTWRETSANPLPIDNRTMLHILDALQMLRISIGGANFPLKLSYKTLGIEQIGHVYEGLLDHNAIRADEPVIGLGGKKGLEPEVKLSTLEEWLGSGQKKLFAELVKLGVGSSPKVLKNRFESELSAEKFEKIRHVCDAIDGSLFERVQPFIAVIRFDNFDQPVIIPQGGIFVTTGTDRRATGSHYTTRDLTEPIVERTLEPQVYVGPAEGLERENWSLKKPEELLSLKILDPACGSGAFLVQACRYLGNKLVESWSQAIDETGGSVNIDGKEMSSSKDVPVPEDDEERMHLAQRLIVQRCLYGVDKNHLASEMTKLSLWLLVLAKNEPFTFLDHAIKCGDSLVGLTCEQIKGLDWETQADPLFADIDDAATEAMKRRGEIVGLGVGHEEEKALLHRSAESVLEDAKLVGDVVVAAFFDGSKDKERRSLREQACTLVNQWRAGKTNRSALEKIAGSLRSGEHPLSPFHWELEFPEVFGRENSGFDVVVGNPPFQGGRNLTATQGSQYSQWLVESQAQSSAAANLVARFYRRSFDILRSCGSFGLIASKAISEGDTRATGLRWICTHNGKIFNATTRLKWPGDAAVVVSFVHVIRGEWHGEYCLDGNPVPTITAFLFHAGGHDDPHKLKANNDKSFQGSIMLGIGFTFDDTDSTGIANSIAEMNSLITDNPNNQEVIFPYIGGMEVNKSPNQEHHRYVINFGEKSEAECTNGWPDLMKILEDKVKPERSTKDRIKYPRMVDEWWKYWNARPRLYAAIADLDRVLAIPRVAMRYAPVFLPPRQVFSEQLILVPDQRFQTFGILTSGVHELWFIFQASTFGSSAAPRYTPTSCFETFPFPKDWETDSTLEAAGRAYYEYRAALMVENDQGLTTTSSRFHDHDETDAKILKLRELHAEMDRAVLNVYGWDDIPTDCEFIADYEVEEGKTIPWKYRWPDKVHDEVLARLLELNQERYEEEVAAGMHSKKVVRKKKPKKKAADDGGGLFGN